MLDFGVGKGQDAIGALVRSLLGIAPGSGKAVRREKADQAIDQGLVAGDRAAHLNDLLDLPQPLALRGLYDAMDNETRNRGQQDTVAELVRNGSRHQPLFLKIEDVHWADGLVLDYLARLAQAVSECPAVLVLTSRIEGDPLDQNWRAATGGAPLTTIDVTPLGEREALELATDFLDVGNRFAQSCVERAEGNPLFLEQLLRSAEETTDDSLPGTVQGIVQARMDSLEEADREALQAASVMGQRFTVEALRHLLASPNYAPDGLVAHFLVRPEGAGYLFAHALIQEGVYASLVKPRRHELHRRAAEWFAAGDPALRAEHLERAEDPAAAEAYLEAATLEANGYRYERARSLVGRGLALAGDVGPRFRLTCLQGDVARELGQAGASIEAFEAALEVAETDDELSRANIGLAEGMRILDRFDDGFRALDRAEAAAVRAEVKADLAHIHYLRGNHTKSG